MNEIKHPLEDTVLLDVVFRVKVYDEKSEESLPYSWQDLTTKNIFANKKILLFSVPGAFCHEDSTYNVPEYERLYSEFKKLDIDEIYCITPNDWYVNHAWSEHCKFKNVKLIPDGNMHLLSSLGMSVSKKNYGMLNRCWRFVAIINDCVIEKMFEEPNKRNEAREDLPNVTNADSILKLLSEDKKPKEKPKRKTATKTNTKKKPSVTKKSK